MTVEATARVLANDHVANDDQTRVICWVPAENEVRLIEVTESIGDRGEILPFRFTPAEDIPFESVVILLSPNDWERIKRGELSVPPWFDRWMQTRQVLVGDDNANGA